MEPTVVEDEDLAWMVSGIDRAGHRMAAMLEDILAYARVGGDLQSRDTDLGEVVAEVLSDLAPVLDARRADVTVKDLPVVRADTQQLYSVLLNLLANAVKFTADDVVPQVTVAAERRDDVWRVTVTDNGIGVAAERREDMFVLFSRADKRVDGSGIGLATARRVVEAHGGRIGMQAAEPRAPPSGSSSPPERSPAARRDPVGEAYGEEAGVAVGVPDLAALRVPGGRGHRVGALAWPA